MLISPYKEKGEAMFASQGLADHGAYSWQRAMLSIGDYLLPSGRQNYSFLFNPVTDQASWKRLLRGTGPNGPEARKILHRLWDRLVTGRSVGGQLDEIIADAKDLDLWREALVRTPAAFEYCKKRVIRWNSETEVYLLSKTQMNGAHVELFTFCLYENLLRKLEDDGRLRPFELGGYQEVNGTDSEPCILLIYHSNEQRLAFKVEFMVGMYVIRIGLASVENVPDIQRLLRDSAGFGKNDPYFSKAIGPKDIGSWLQKLARDLKTIPTSD